MVGHHGSEKSSRLEGLLNPARLWSRREVLTTACVPRSAGVYAWYFQNVPPAVPTVGCVVSNDSTLLYAGIAPKAPSTNGRRPGAQTLAHRIRYHMKGRARTLRLTLGCLLGLELRRVGGGNRRTFAAQEADLSAWMEQNASVCWIETQEPWVVETQMLAAVNLPLNLDQNRQHAFHSALSAVRRAAKRRAEGLPVWGEGPA